MVSRPARSGGQWGHPAAFGDHRHGDHGQRRRRDDYVYYVGTSDDYAAVL